MQNTSQRVLKQIHLNLVLYFTGLDEVITTNKLDHRMRSQENRQTLVYQSLLGLYVFHSEK